MDHNLFQTWAKLQEEPFIKFWLILNESVSSTVYYYSPVLRFYYDSK